AEAPTCKVMVIGAGSEESICMLWIICLRKSALAISSAVRLTGNLLLAWDPHVIQTVLGSHGDSNLVKPGSLEPGCTICYFCRSPVFLTSLKALAGALILKAACADLKFLFFPNQTRECRYTRYTATFFLRSSEKLSGYNHLRILSSFRKKL